MGVYKDLGKNAAVIFIGNVGSRMIGFLMLPFYTRWLSTAEYGTTDMIFVYSSLITQIVTLSIHEAIFVFPSNASDKKITTYYSSSLIFSLVSLMLTFVGFAILRHFFDPGSFLYNYSWYIYAFIVVYFLQDFFQQFCKGLNKLYVFAFCGLIVTFFTAALAFAFIPKWGVLGYIYSILAANMISIIYACFGCKAISRFKLKSFSKQDLIVMLKYSYPLMINAIIFWVMQSFNRVAMSKFLDLVAVGLFSIAMKLPQVLQTLITSMSGAWQLSIINEYDKKGYASFYNNVTRAVIGITAIGLALMTIFSEQFISLFTGASFHKVWIYVPFLGLTIFFQIFSTLVSSIFSAVRESKYYLYANIVGMIASLIACFVLIPLWGMWGAVVSMILPLTVSFFVRLFFSMKYTMLTDLTYYLLLLILLIVQSLFVSVFHNIYLGWAFTVIIIAYSFLRNKTQISKLLYKIKK